MADEKTFISQLNEAETANDTDIMIIEGQETKKISFLSLFNALKGKFSNIYKPINAITKADEVTYDNSSSGLKAGSVQGAVDEVNAKADENAANITELSENMSDIDNKIVVGVCNDIDKTVDTGFYYMAGSNTAGTFPTSGGSADGLYSTMIVIKRYSTTANQLLLTSKGAYTRQLTISGSNITPGSWITLN